MGVTPDSTYRTPNSNYMNTKGVQAWLAERAFVALFVACHRGHVKLVQTLVDSGKTSIYLSLTLVCYKYNYIKGSFLYC